MALLKKFGINKETVCTAIEKGKYGEIDVNRDFISEDGQKRKKRACTIRRTAIPRQLREAIDKGSYY